MVSTPCQGNNTVWYDIFFPQGVEPMYKYMSVRTAHHLHMHDIQRVLISFLLHVEVKKNKPEKEIVAKCVSETHASPFKFMH